jgi:hypothetical protein
VEQVQLNGELIRELPFRRTTAGPVFDLALPRLGIGTLRITP